MWAVEHNIRIVLIDRRGEMIDRVGALLSAHFAEETLANRIGIWDLRQSAFAFAANPLQSGAADAPSRVRALLLGRGRGPLGSGVQTEQLLRFSLLALSKEWSLYEVDVFLTSEQFRKQVLETVEDALCLRFFARFDALPASQESQWVEPVLNKHPTFFITGGTSVCVLPVETAVPAHPIRAAGTDFAGRAGQRHAPFGLVFGWQPVPPLSGHGRHAPRTAGSGGKRGPVHRG